MNFWMHFRFLWRLVLSVLRPTLWRSLLCALLFLVAGLYFTGSSPLSAQMSSTSVALPEYIMIPPSSTVGPNTDDYKVTVVFAWNEGNAEPATADYPVVYWFRNGNYIAKVTSTIRNKTVDILGNTWYECWDPYASGGQGVRFNGVSPIGTRKILWNNQLSVSLKDAAADKTAVYTAYIPKIGATTQPAQIVLSPAQALGGVRPTLNVVRSPSNQTAQVGGSVRLWGDVESHVNGLMQNPFGVAVDGSGLIFVTDTLNHVIRKVQPGGRGRTVAGLDGGILNDSGSAIKAQQSYDPVISTVTGSLLKGQVIPSVLSLASLSNVATSSRLYLTAGTGTLKQSDGSAGSFTANGFVTVARISVTGGTVATNESINATSSGTLTFDIRSSTGARSVFMDRPPTSGFSWNDMVTVQDPFNRNSYRVSSPSLPQVPSSEPLFNAPEALAVADDGSIFIADTQNDAIRRIYLDSGGQTHVQTICAGSLQMAYSGGALSTTSGTYSNIGASVSLTAPRGLVFKGSMFDTPTLYVLDFNKIQKITLNSGTAGVGAGSYINGVAYIGSVTQYEGWQGDPDASRLYAPRGLVVTTGKNARGIEGCTVVYVADTVNHVIRKLTLEPKFTEETAQPANWSSEVVAGFVGAKAQTLDINKTPVYTDGTTGYFPPVKFASCQVVYGGTWISVPTTAGIQPKDTLWLNAGSYQVSTGSYQVSSGTYTVARVVSGSLITMSPILANTGTYSATLSRAAYAPSNLARLAYPSGLTLGHNQSLYFTELGSHNIRRLVIDDVNPGVSARVETVAGQSQPGPFDGSKGEGAGKAAAFFYPTSIAFDVSQYPYTYAVADSANHCVRRLVVQTGTVSVTGNASLQTPTKITGLSSMSNIRPLMRVSGKNIPPGAYVLSTDTSGKTITLNVPVTGAIDATQTITLEQDTFTSTTAYGYPGNSGNRDFAGECEEYQFQWLKYGTPLFDISTPDSSYTNISGSSSDYLNLSKIRTRDSGPYELRVTNKFGISADTAQASVYVMPQSGVVPTTDKPYFYSKDQAYARLTVAGTSELTQLRSDLDQMNFSLRANILPADNVSYQWQILIPGKSPVDLSDSLVSRITDPDVARLLGADGVGGLTLVGTKTSTLQITGFQKSLVDRRRAGESIELPSVTFQVKAFPLVVKSASTSAETVMVPGTDPITTDQAGQTVNPISFTAASAPVITGQPSDIEVRYVQTGSLISVVEQTARVVPLPVVGGSLVTLTPTDVVSAYPLLAYTGVEDISLADPKNPDFRVRGQWMKSDQPPGRASSVAKVVEGGTFDYRFNRDYGTGTGQLIVDFNGKDAFYWVRYWTGSGLPDDNDPTTVVGAPLSGNFIQLTLGGGASVGSISYKTPADEGDRIRFVRVNVAPNLDKQQFVLDAYVDGATQTPDYKWRYWKWGAQPSEGKYLKWGNSPLTSTFLTTGSISGGTLASGTIWAVSGGSWALSGGSWTLAGGSYEALGQGVIKGSKYESSLSFTAFENMPKVGEADPPSKDLSGLYCLDSTVTDGLSSTVTPRFWIVATRQKPVAYGLKSDLYSLTSGGVTSSNSSLAVDVSGSQNVTMRANVLLPLPDLLPVNDTYGGFKVRDIYYQGTPSPSTLTAGSGFDNLVGFGSFTDKSATLKEDLFTWNRGTTPVAHGGNVSVNGGTISVGPVYSKDLGLYSLKVRNNCGILTNLGPDGVGGLPSGWTLFGSGKPFVIADPSAKSTAGATLTATKNGSLVQRVAVGQPVALEIPVNSSFWVKYFWSFSTSGAGPWKVLPSSSANSDSKYFIRSAALQDSGVYRVGIRYSNTAAFSSSQDLFGGDETKWPRLNLLVEPMPDPALPKLDAAGAQVVTSGNARILVAGANVTLSAVSLQTGVSFLNSPTTSFFTFQWKKNGVPLVGETRETLKLPKITKSQAGNYTVEVSGVAGVKTSSALVVAISSSATSVETRYPVTFQNLQDIKYYTVPVVSNGVAPGTVVTITGMSSLSQTLLGWRVWDAAGNEWNLPARAAQFVMPERAVTVVPTLGRSSAGTYSGFLGLDKPWGILEWDIFPLIAQTPKALSSSPPAASQVRGYFTAVVTPMGSVTGKVFLEGKSYPFSTALAFASDGTYSGPIKIQATLADRTPWLLTGKISLNMGLRKAAVVTKASQSVVVMESLSGGTLSGGTVGLSESMTVSGYGIPEGTVVTALTDANGIVDQKTVQISAPATISSDTPGFPLTFGADQASSDNVMHVKLDEVVLEVTPPIVKSGQTLYGVAACNAGVYSSLGKFISTKTSEPAPAMPKYTAAIVRMGIKDAEAVPGRGGVISMNISNLGLATITGWLPNGAKLTFSGYGGRACFVKDGADPDPLPLFSPILTTADIFDGASTAPKLMQETLERHTASISIPIWSTSPLGDKPAEPLFGALLLSDTALHGCLGVLNTSSLTNAGTFATASEYTHNYISGYMYDSTIPSGWTKPLPFTQTAQMALSSFAPISDATTYPLEDLRSPAALVPTNRFGTTTAMGTFGYSGNNFVLTPSSNAANKILSMSGAVDNVTGMFSGQFLEATDRYVSLSSLSGPNWAVVGVMPNLFKSSLNVRFYAVTIQKREDDPDYFRLNLNLPPNLFGGARGFFIRGATPIDSLKNTLGNGYQDSWLPNSLNPTYRVEGFNIDVYEPN